MVARRDLILGLAAVAAAGAAYQLTPRKKVLLLLEHAKMADIVPVVFGPWSAAADPNLVTPDTTGKLAALLYSELVSRVYTNEQTGREVMMLIAYGDTQSDLLQLHRPESCYPAVGYELKMTAPAAIRLADAAVLPGRKVVAVKGERQENIVYWARLGEFLPDSSRAQKVDRLRTAMRGYIPDGALFRFSDVSNDADGSIERLESFIRDLVTAIPPGKRRAILGTQLANAMSGSAPAKG